MTQPRSPGVNIDAWTSETLTSLGAMRIAAEPVGLPIRSVSAALEIPLDAEHRVRRAAQPGADIQRANREQETDEQQIIYPTLRRRTSQRDSLRKREALLKGKEGSRRRQKWENDHFIGNPWVQPPDSHDWEVRPTYPVRSVPYYLAPLWDEKQARERLERANGTLKGLSRERAHENAQAKVPRELRQKLKKSRAARGLLQDLEEQVRQFVRTWNERRKGLEEQGFGDVDSSEDEEVVFVGRDGQMRDGSAGDDNERLRRDKLIFEGLADDHGASFGRWLVHSIATYYDLHTWSVTTGRPARREAYVGIPESMASGGKPPNLMADWDLPKPLWGLV